MRANTDPPILTENAEMKKRILPLLLGSAIAGTIGILTACGDSEESLLGPAPAALTPGERIAYSSVQSIVQQKCQRCHAAYADSNNLAAVAEAAHSTVEGGSMPQGDQLSVVQKASLLAWLEQAAASAPPAEPKPITNSAGRVEFSSVAPIVEAKCAVCHGGYSDSAKLSATASAAQDAIEAGYMPFPGPSPLTPVERATLVTWLKQEQGL